MDRLSAVTSYAASWVPQRVSNALSSVKPFAERLFARMRENSPSSTSAGLVAKRFTYSMAYGFAAVFLALAAGVVYGRFKAKQASQSSPKLVYRFLEFSTLGLRTDLKEMTRDIICQINEGLKNSTIFPVKEKSTGRVVQVQAVTLRINELEKEDALQIIEALGKQKYILVTTERNFQVVGCSPYTYIAFRD